MNINSFIKEMFGQAFPGISARLFGWRWVNIPLYGTFFVYMLVWLVFAFKVTLKLIQIYYENN